MTNVIRVRHTLRIKFGDTLETIFGEDRKRNQFQKGYHKTWHQRALSGTQIQCSLTRLLLVLLIICLIQPLLVVCEYTLQLRPNSGHILSSPHCIVQPYRSSSLLLVSNARGWMCLLIPPRLPSANSTISVDRVELSATLFLWLYLTIVERKWHKVHRRDRLFN